MKTENYTYATGIKCFPIFVDLLSAMGKREITVDAHWVRSYSYPNGNGQFEITMSTPPLLKKVKQIRKAFRCSNPGIRTRVEELLSELEDDARSYWKEEPHPRGESPAARRFIRRTMPDDDVWPEEVE